VHGSNAYGDAIERVIATARGAADRIRAIPHLELVRDPELSIVLFRRKGWNADDYAAWSTRLLDEQIGFVAPTRWKGETVARFAFLHPDTTLDIVDEILATTA
jgi:glutamate/tyrosine decarboxylase-like PLP-dependent enzyme